MGVLERRWVVFLSALGVLGSPWRFIRHVWRARASLYIQQSAQEARHRPFNRAAVCHWPWLLPCR